MNNKPILITGCQRSGTTLLSLMLGSHPLVTRIDEDEFKAHKLSEYLMDESYHPYVCFKLPKLAHLLAAFTVVPNLKVLFNIRDPRDVVVSMRNLRKPHNLGTCGRLHALLRSGANSLAWRNMLRSEVEVNWLAHPRGARAEIEKCLAALEWGSEWPAAISCLQEQYERLRTRQFVDFTRSDEVMLGTLVWYLKNRILLQQAHVHSCKVVRYENVVTDSEKVMRDILQFLGLPWSNEVLRHHEINTGIKVGGTDSARPVDAHGIGRWRNALNEKDAGLIAEVCKDQELVDIVEGRE